MVESSLAVEASQGHEEEAVAQELELEVPVTEVAVPEAAALEH